VDGALLPTLNACLNAVAGTLLVYGRILVKRGEVERHRRVMISAFAVSSLFLFFYVLHKWLRDFENTTFNVEGAAKLAYLLLLATHVTLAAIVPALATTLIVLGLRDKRATHRRLARIAWPIWMYVSVTGVLIYLLLYHLNPSP